MGKTSNLPAFRDWLDRESEKFRRRLIEASDEGLHGTVTVEVSFKDGMPLLGRDVSHVTRPVVL